MRTKIFGVLAVALMLAVALAPLAYSGDVEASPTFDWDYQPDYEEAEALAIEVVNALPENWTEEDLENALVQYGAEYGAVDPVTGAFVLGFILGVIATTFVYTAFQSESAGNPGHVVEYEQEMLARNIESQLSATVRIIKNLLPNDGNMLRYTSTYWERAVEFTISNPNVWSKNKSLDVEGVLDNAGVRKAINNYIHTWQKVIANELIGASREQPETIIGDDCYDGMALSFDWGVDQLIQSEPSSLHWLYGDFRSAVKTESTSTTVYLDVPNEASESTQYIDDEFANRIYLYSPNGTNATMTPLFSGGSVITLTPGVNKVTSYQPGLYRLSTSGVIYAGDFTYSSGANPAEIQSCMVMTDGDGSFAYALYDGNSKNVVVYKGSSHNTVSKLELSVSYIAPNTTNKTLRAVDLKDVIIRYQELLDASAYIVTECTKDARVTWSIFDACEESSSYIHPSTIMTVLRDSSLSEENLLTNYYFAMMQLANYYEKYGDRIGSMEIEADSSTTDVLLYGDIFCNGQLIVSGAIMTPSVFVSDETYKVGESHVVQQQTMCTVWQQNAGSIDDFTTFSTVISNIPVATLDAGIVIDVHAIKYKGEHVSEHTLTVPPIVYVPNPIPEPTSVPEPIKVMDADILVIVIILELAVIFFLIGYIQGDPLKGLIIAIIVFVIGFFFSGTISSLALGTFEMPWWWPF